MIILAALLVFVAPDPAKMVDAIRTVEGASVTAIGRHGERGPYQTGREVWRQHSKKPYWWASSPAPEHQAEARRVAIEHVKWLERNLPAAGMPVSAYTVALAWNAGIGHVERREFVPENFLFADHARNWFNRNATP